MVRYVDPETHPEGAPHGHSRQRESPGERLTRLRARNASLTGIAAVEAAREVALRRLDARACSRGELRAAILRQGFAEAVADDVLDRLERVGLLDDTAYAAALARERFRSGRVGRAISDELRRKHVSDADIAAALDQIDEEDQRARAEELVEHRLRAMGGVDHDRAFRRLTGMLARKGYSPSLCVSVVSAALSRREAQDLP